MDIQEKLEKIAKYRERGENWYDLVCIVQEVTRKEEWRSLYTSNADWLKEVARSSGYYVQNKEDGSCTAWPLSRSL